MPKFVIWVSSGLRVEPEKTELVLSFLALGNLKQLRRFLGQSWVWDADQESSFANLKRKLTEAPTMALPYDLTIVHRASALNSVPDGLSRATESVEPLTPQICTCVEVIPKHTDEWYD